MNLNLSELTKEQKQYIVLGVVGVVGIGAALVFGVQFSMSSMAETKTELEDLTVKVERAERELSRKAKTRDDLFQTIEVLESHLSNIPPEENYYSWATEIVYSKGRKAGLEIQSVDEVGMARGKKKAVKDPVYFETYSLRINARGGYAQTKAFLKDIEDSHPLVRFTGIDISKSNNPETHEIQLFVQWPFKLDRIATLFEEQSKKSKALLAKKSKSGAEKPAPVVASTPKPEPKPIVAAPVVAKKPTPPVSKPAPVASVPKVAKTPPPPVSKPEPVKPAPVIVKQPKPPVSKPAPIQPEPVVEKPAPVVVAVPAPKPVAPKPVVEKPAPVVVAAPVATPEPVKPTPVVEKPAPVITAVPNPKPAPKPVKVAAKPAPVVAEAKPSVKQDHTESILASIDMINEAPEEPAKEENEMTSLLASLGSRGDEEPEAQVKAEPAVLDDLAAYIQGLENKPSTEAGTADPQGVDESIVPVTAPVEAGAPVQYVSSGKSANILEELLMQGKPKASASLGSFLDGIVGDINDKR